MADNRIKIAVIEDEMIVGAKIAMYLSELGYEVTGIIGQSDEVLLHIELNMPDIVLLDVQLKGKLDGIELANILHEKSQIPIVFLTANSDDATFERARKTKPDAFLTKPFKKLDLKRTLELVVSRMSIKSITEEEAELGNSEEENQIITPLSDRIFVLNKDKKVKIMFDAILYIEAERSYCRIHTSSKSYLLTMPLKSLENVLPAVDFLRIHRSYIVNIKHVDEMDEHTIMVDGKLLGLSRSYRKEFLKRIRAL